MRDEEEKNKPLPNVTMARTVHIKQGIHRASALFSPGQGQTHMRAVSHPVRSERAKDCFHDLLFAMNIFEAQRLCRLEQPFQVPIK